MISSLHFSWLDNAKRWKQKIIKITFWLHTLIFLWKTSLNQLIAYYITHMLSKSFLSPLPLLCLLHLRMIIRSDALALVQKNKISWWMLSRYTPPHSCSCLLSYIFIRSFLAVCLFAFWKRMWFFVNVWSVSRLNVNFYALLLKTVILKRLPYV